MSIKRTLKTIYRTTAPLHASRSRLTESAAMKILAGYTPDPNTTCVANNTLDPQYDLQIIVPAYNVERFVAQCLESALHQKTRYSYIITVVNDGSTDRTSEIIESYSTQHSDRMEVINQENRGFSGARNVALKYLRGKYITFLDSDDMLEDGAIESLLSCAESSGSDIVQGGWLEFSNGEGKTKVVINYPATPGERCIGQKCLNTSNSRKGIGLRIRQYRLFYTALDTAAQLSMT